MAVTAKRAEQPAAGFAPGRFLREVFEELRKVVWPTPGELYRYTLVGTDYLLGQITKGALYNGTGH
jgi:hypothetical protein